MSTACLSCATAQLEAATNDAPARCAGCSTTWEPVPECRGCIDARDALERLCVRSSEPWTLCDECLSVVSLDARHERDVEDGGEHSARAARRTMLADFDNLARWRPRLANGGVRGASNRERGCRSRRDVREGFARAVETERRLASLGRLAAAEASRRGTDVTTSPTDLERGVAVLEWIVDHRGVRRRSGLVRAIGRAFAAKESRARSSAKSASTRLGAELLFLAESLWAASAVEASRETPSEIGVSLARRDAPLQPDRIAASQSAASAVGASRETPLQFGVAVRSVSPESSSDTAVAS